ncbi:MAG: DUF881 domain-containing protein [Armatimonadota bacterium]|nr:DUF881 domain-containing protein [Armatimonadota bacterium]
MSVFPSTIRSRTWVVWVTALSLALGGLLAASLKTQQTLRLRFGVSPGGRGGVVAALSQQVNENEELRAEIQKLRKKNSAWEERFASGTNHSQAIYNELQDAKILAGLLSVEGDGVIVTLQDSKQIPKDIGADLNDETLNEIEEAGIVHDYDLRRVLDELFAAGAEAVAVGEQRVVSTTAVLCDLRSIRVNDVKMASPFTIKAIGNTKEIMGALKTPGGLLDRDLGALGMIKAEAKENILIPAYSGSTRLKYARAPR